jgi:hypothetical protein
MVNTFDYAVNRPESLGFARMSLHEAPPSADGNPLGLGGSETERETALLNGSNNEEGQSDKEEDNRSEVRVGEESGLGGKLSCSLHGLDVHCVESYGWAGS